MIDQYLLTAVVEAHKEPITKERAMEMKAIACEAMVILPIAFQEKSVEMALISVDGRKPNPDDVGAAPLDDNFLFECWVHFGMILAKIEGIDNGRRAFLQHTVSVAKCAMNDENAIRRMVNDLFAGVRQ